MTSAGVPSAPTGAGAVADILAVGLGPFNLGLAALAEPLGLDVRVLEAKDEFSWHPGMLIEGSTIQVPFMADLVTMADPTSRYSFLNYLKHCRRLYPFYIRESFYPLRAEYDAYCRWVAGRLPGIRYGHTVESLDYDAGADTYVATCRTREGTATVRGRHLVVGVGTKPWLPASLRGAGEHVIHSAQYLNRRADLTQARRVTIVGSGQSAAEIFHDLLHRMPDGDHELSWVTRSPRFFPMEYTKLTLEMTSPEYVDHFHALPPARRDELNRAQRSLYKGISGDLIDDIHDTLYRLSLDGPVRARLGTAQEVTASRVTARGVELDLCHLDTTEMSRISADLVVACTGYRSGAPALLANLPGIEFDDAGRPGVTRNFTLDGGTGRVFVQNGEEHTHSLTAPDLGMGPYRNSVILATILGREVYPIEERIAFQTFGALHD